MPSSDLSVCLSPQHQQQVAQAVERAKQVTMTELNAIIGVRGLPNLPLTVCIPLLFLSFTMTRGNPALRGGSRWAACSPPAVPQPPQTTKTPPVWHQARQGVVEATWAAQSLSPGANATPGAPTSKFDVLHEGLVPSALPEPLSPGMSLRVLLM